MQQGFERLSLAIVLKPLDMMGQIKKLEEQVTAAQARIQEIPKGDPLTYDEHEEEHLKDRVRELSLSIKGHHAVLSLVTEESETVRVTGSFRGLFELTRSLYSVEELQDYLDSGKPPVQQPSHEMKELLRLWMWIQERCLLAYRQAAAAPVPTAA